MPPKLKRSPARKLFNRYKASLIAELGRDALDTTTINRIGKQEFGSHWGGTHPQDRVKLEPNKFYVINTDTHEGDGEHWMGLYTTKTRAYLYDSNRGFELGRTDRVPHMEQIGYDSAICGDASLAFLLTVRDLGIRAASEI
jgi:hypothetical protein